MMGRTKRRRRLCGRWRSVGRRTAVAALLPAAVGFSSGARHAAAETHLSKPKPFIIKYKPDIGHAHQLEARALAATGTAGIHAALHNLISLADSQDAVAEYWLGRYDIAAYKPGTRQYGWGIRWLQDSQAKGSRRAAELLYALYKQSHANSELTQKYLQRAANLGWPPAQYDLGIRLLRGHIAKSLLHGINLLTQAARTRYLPAIKVLYNIAVDRTIEPRLQIAARSGLVMVARTGWGKGDGYAAAAFYNGLLPNYLLAWRYARAGADRGDAFSEEVLGHILLTGNGHRRNVRQAFLFLNASASKYRYALALSGEMLLYGVGTPSHIRWGLRRLKAAYREGSGRAAVILGEYYASKNNVAQAQNWFQGAIRIGAKPWNLVATLHLGVLMVQTAKTPADQAAGVRLIHRAAALGLAPAEVTLGKVYAIGMGVTLNRAKAIFWLRKAAAHGGAVAIAADKLLAALHAAAPKTGH
jgi:TPR repeat protein